MPGAKWMVPLTLLGIGLACKFGGPLAWATEFVPSFRHPLCLGPAVLGNVLYISGCFGIARAKERSLAWGLSGFLCVLALPILYRLADRSAEGPLNQAE